MNKTYKSLQLNFKVWIETDSNISILGDGKWKLLKAIKETGSLKSAVEILELSYRQTWTRLKNIEKRLGFPLIEKCRGGSKGGYTTLTPQGEKIVKFFDKIYQEFEPKANTIFNDMIEELNSIHEA